MNLIANQVLKTVIENSIIPSLVKKNNSLKSKNEQLLDALREFEKCSCDGYKYIHACHICYEVNIEDAYDCDFCDIHFGDGCCGKYACLKCDIYLCDNCDDKSVEEYISNHMKKNCNECIEYLDEHKKYHEVSEELLTEESSEAEEFEAEEFEEHNQDQGISEEFTIKAEISSHSDIMSEVNNVDNK